MARLDGMLRHIFVPMFRFGLFDKPIKGIFAEDYSSIQPPLSLKWT